MLTKNKGRERMIHLQMQDLLAERGVRDIADKGGPCICKLPFEKGQPLCVFCRANELIANLDRIREEL